MGTVNLIGETRAKTGLKVKAILDTNRYETSVGLSKKDMDQLHLTRHRTPPDSNYTLSPRDWTDFPVDGATR